MIEEANLRGGAVFPDAVERGPIDPVELWGIDRLDGVRVVQIEAEVQISQVEIRQIFDPGVFEIIVGIIEHRDREIRRVAERTADAEARRRGGVNTRGGGERAEATEIDRAVGLKFLDRFWQRVQASGLSLPLRPPKAGFQKFHN